MALESAAICANLKEFIELSHDGYAIFDGEDRLIYWNKKFAELMYISETKSDPITLDHLLIDNFSNNRGVRVDSGDIESFISYAKKIRRSRDFRLFEVDFVDGRWFLFSEQLNEKNEMLVQIKDITKQKVYEKSLADEVTDLRSVALTDELTRVGNRRALVESVKNELSRCQRSGASMTMLLIDLDLFKTVNDKYGHHAGDAALRHVADLIKRALRPYDILGRIGGEEFAVFLSNTTGEDGLLIAERTREAIEGNPVVYEEREINLTISLGMTTQGCNANFEDLYKQADEALYQAKASGRNRVSIYSIGC